MPDHDPLYHRLFSHPAMVEQLVRDFVAEPWVAELDLTNMERVNGRLDEQRGQWRETDIVWRVPLKSGGDAYLLLLLEFQSRPDRWMSLRVLVYTGLLWQHVVAEKRLMRGGKLPPVFPIVLYNGARRWRAPTSVADLIGLSPDSPLWPWQPAMQYHLIDEHRLSDDDLAHRETLTALLFRLENPPNPEQIKAIGEGLIAWFRRHEGFEALRAEFTALLRRAIASIPGWPQGEWIPDDMLEIQPMLQTRMAQWMQERKREAIQEGRQVGLQEGRQEGHREGVATILTRQLTRRFGPLPPRIQTQIAEADPGLLEAWSLRLLDADSLNQVFD